MLDAMQASRLPAFTFAARFSISTWVAGETVAQLMKMRPLAPESRLSPFVAKTFSIALSSVTTVMMTSANAVTSASFSGLAQPSSLAKASADSGRAS